MKSLQILRQSHWLKVWTLVLGWRKRVLSGTRPTFEIEVGKGYDSLPLTVIIIITPCLDLFSFSSYKIFWSILCSSQAIDLTEIEPARLSWQEEITQLLIHGSRKWAAPGSWSIRFPHSSVTPGWGEWVWEWGKSNFEETVHLWFFPYCKEVKKSRITGGH